MAYVATVQVTVSIYTINVVVWRDVSGTVHQRYYVNIDVDPTQAPPTRTFDDLGDLMEFLRHASSVNANYVDVSYADLNTALVDILNTISQLGT